MHLPAGISGVCMRQETEYPGYYPKTHFAFGRRIGVQSESAQRKTSYIRETVNGYRESGGDFFIAIIVCRRAEGYMGYDTMEELSNAKTDAAK